MIEYGQTIDLKVGVVLEFPDFKLIFLEESQRELNIGKSNLLSTTRRFKVLYGENELILVASTGMGFLTPLRFSIVKIRATFEFNWWNETTVVNKLSLDLTKISICDKLTQNDVNDLTREEYGTYENTFRQSSVQYFTFGGDANLPNSNLEPEPLFYGTGSKRLRKTNNGWMIVQGGGIVPEFQIRPIYLDKDDFKNAMQNLGVETTLLEEFFSYVPDYTNF